MPSSITPEKRVHKADRRCVRFPAEAQRSCRYAADRERERESVAAVLKNVLLHNPHRKSNIGEGSNVNPVFRLAMDAISSVCIDGLSQERILKTR